MLATIIVAVGLISILFAKLSKCGSIPFFASSSENTIAEQWDRFNSFVDRVFKMLNPSPIESVSTDKRF